MLADLVKAVRAILGNTYVGTYVQGSIALDAANNDSDCDFIVATTQPPHGDAEVALRALHDELPTREGYWTQNLEGSYADTTSLRSVDHLGVPWLFNDHGTRTLVWDTHCNTPHTRWILRNRGITVDGPPVRTLVDDVPPQALRNAMRNELNGMLDGILKWAPQNTVWTQRYIVATYCRVLYTLDTAEVASKPQALRWARENLDPKWRPLLTQVLQDRELAWDLPPRPGSMELAHEFAAYVESL